MDERLIGKLEEVEQAFTEMLGQLTDPDVLADQECYREVSIRHAQIKPIVDAFRRHRAGAQELAEAEDLVVLEDDPEMREYLLSVAREQRALLDRLELELQSMLVPKDLNDDKDVIVELRAAVGGDEAALWAADLYRMFERFAERHGWVIEPIGVSATDGGGLKEATFAVKGKGAYSRLKWEAGPHRVQRVPKTESQGRIHTSIATVAVLPEVEAVEVDIQDADLEIETMRSQGPGGQSVNTTDSAVRVTHKPSGIVVSCQDEKSQLQNKLKALRVLRARLYQQQRAEQLGERSEARKAQVGSGERAEKIRTYNFKENRVTDHRVGVTLHSLPEVLDGDLDEFHTALNARDTADRLADEA